MPCQVAPALMKRVLDYFDAVKIGLTATPLHADMVNRLLDKAFKAIYEEEYNEAAVRKITGQSDNVKQLSAIQK